MKINLYSLLVMTFLSGGCHGEALELPGCPEQLSPVVAPPPLLPGKTDNYFHGTVKVHAIIDRNGKVVDAEIVAVDLHQSGRGRAKPYGYNEAVLNAVRSWQYPSQAYKCAKEITVKFK